MNEQSAIAPSTETEPERALLLDEAAAERLLDSELAGNMTALGQRDAAERRRITLGRILLLAMLALMVFALAGSLRSRFYPPHGDMGMVPDLALTTFEGETIRLADLRGQGVVINFWASWCGPCKVETPMLVEAWEEARHQGVVFLGVVVSDTRRPAEAFVREYGMTYPNGMDDTGEWDRTFGIQGIPATFFIDADGRIVEQARGALPSREFLQRRLRQIVPGA
jgi:cytochrome c biogenesis protein CcmG, thiol:disulfide interchange protein DsbE